MRLTDGFRGSVSAAPLWGDADAGLSEGDPFGRDEG
jgi:hypothetical protein